MRTQTLLITAATLLASAAVAFSQSTKPSTEKPAKASPSKAPVVSPEVLSGGGVTFRFQAPKATEVKVSGQFGPETVLTKDTNGLWSATVPSVPAGVHEYHFVVDGLNVIDPQNSEAKPQRWPGVSILHIPASPLAPWDLQDIPHGTIP